MAADMSTDQKSEPATLQVGSEEVKLNMTQESAKDELNLLDRDPNNMNADIKAQFHDLFGEPDREIYSFDKIWILAYKVFGITKLWCYRITSVVLALPLAVFWGISFACVSFCRIWICIPCLRSCDIELMCIRKVWDVCLQTFLAPCWVAWGMIFNNIRIKLIRSEN